MQSDNYRPLVPIACRLVSYDQWFVTHLDDSWKVKQVKHWILSKCNLIQASDPPSQRPVSPITFASTIRTKSSLDSGDDGYYEDDEYDDDSDDFDEPSHRHYDLRRQNIYARQSAKLPHTSASGQPSTSRKEDAGSNSVADQYTLISFSTGAILEDDFALSWYNLRPYELLEIHRSGNVVSLPREILADYVQPYFEARVRALRAVWSPKSGRFETPPNDRTHSEVYSGKGKDRVAGRLDSFPSMPTPLQSEKKKRRAKVEWRDRRVVINQGTLTLCKNQGGAPMHHFSLPSLVALRGAESLERACSIIAEQRVVCIKFWTPAQRASPVAASPPPSIPSSPVAESWVADMHSEDQDGLPQTLESTKAQMEPQGQTDQTNSQTRPYTGDYRPEDICRGEGEWLVLDMLDDHAFSSILRILHRYAQPPISSSFLPSSSIVAMANYWNNVSSPAITPFVYSSPYDSLPYPEWRINAVEAARKAGMGDVGKPMAWVLWTEKGLGDSLLGNIRRQRQTFTQEMQYKSNSLATSLCSDDESDTDGESEMEWEGWMRDLERQSRTKLPGRTSRSPLGSRQGLSVSHSSSPLPSPPLSDSSSPGRPRNRTPSLTLPRSSTTGSISYPTSPPYPSIDTLMRNPPSREEFSRVSNDFPRAPDRMKTTTTSTVTVGSAPARRRSSTLTPGIVAKLIKDKEKPDRAPHSPNGSSSSGGRVLHNPVTPRAAQKDLVRHARSGSNLRMSSPPPQRDGPQSSIPLPPNDGERSNAGGPSGKKRNDGGRRIMREMSMRAEKLVRGLDSAIDFVDSNP
ncbi:hypothetical protein BV22DRAFT_1031290 [Leucogyrophana mollusca]|uniref:Uncharacterized protein n=1 Tax=Leucogyrophana mollusca TaxID=85980 RepID=A0ACB8BQL8_9AGAM|nr:hypothetical protein BV22DRAFT_1031290 [Leucogyrophana mollusca]